MNKLILLLLSFCPVLAFSQEVYEPFIVEGKVWYYDYATYVGTTRKSYTYKMYFSGDTVIGGKSASISSKNAPTPRCLLRELAMRRMAKCGCFIIIPRTLLSHVFYSTSAAMRVVC